jgi:hypothetical protein
MPRRAGDRKAERELTAAHRQGSIALGLMTGAQYDELMRLSEAAGCQPARPKRGFFAKLFG